jgi:hypothetical protein
MPFMAVAAVVLTGVVAAQGQVASSPTKLVHPIIKDPDHRIAPTSLNQDPDAARSQGQNPRPAAGAPRKAAVDPAAPAPIVAKVDAGLTVSPISVIATISGIKGTLYVTNVGPQEITPMVQLAVCDPKGLKVGTASKTGTALAPNSAQKFVIVATNLNAAEFKLMQLTRAATK